MLAFAAMLPARAAHIETLTVQRDHELINVVASMVIDAPRPFVFQALSDYDHFSEMSDSFVESRFIEPAADGTPRIYTRIEGCIWFFCRTIERYARLELQPVTRIVSIVEPGASDANYAREEWVLEDLGVSTRVYYRHDLQPNFWVPPGIGVWAIRSALSRTTLKAASRIELMAVRNQLNDASESGASPEGNSGSGPPDPAADAGLRVDESTGVNPLVEPANEDSDADGAAVGAAE